jgi:hypoxanthine phosphoribosyltransferase
MDVLLAKLTPLIDKKEIASKIEIVAREIDQEYADLDLVIIMVLKGAVCLVADLIRAIHLPCDIEVVQCRSYRGTTARGSLEVIGLEKINLKDRDCLIVDDIFDSGHTLTTLVAAVQQKGARSVKTLVLLSKNVPHINAFQPDFVLFHIENVFVIGYGLDYEERYRGLPGIFVMNPE